MRSLWSPTKLPRYANRMRYWCSFGVALIGLMTLRPMPVIAQIFPLPLPLQQSDSSIDSNGCLHLQASAVVNAQIDGVFDGLSQPEQLYGGFRLVFVQVEETRKSRFTNTWSVTSPFEKIIEFYGPHPHQAHSWEEYEFVRDTHTILMHTMEGELARPRREATLVLGPAAGTSATLARYNISECWPSSYSWMSSKDKLEEGEQEKLWLSRWLKFAEDDAHRIAKEHTTRPTSTPTSAPTNPCATPSPRVLGSTP